MGYKAPSPCDSVREPFFSQGYCVACNWLVDLHTADGWKKYHDDRAAACDAQADALESRARELRSAASENRGTANTPPPWTPFAATGYVSVHEPRQFPRSEQSR